MPTELRSSLDALYAGLQQRSQLYVDRLGWVWLDDKVADVLCTGRVSAKHRRIRHNDNRRTYQ